MTNIEIYQQNIPQDSPTTEGELTEADQGQEQNLLPPIEPAYWETL